MREGLMIIRAAVAICSAGAAEECPAAGLDFEAKLETISGNYSCAELKARTAERTKFEDCISSVRGQLRVGMSRQDVKETVACLPPVLWHRIMRTETAVGTREQWGVYRDPDRSPIVYVYFDGERVSGADGK